MIVQCGHTHPFSMQTNKRWIVVVVCKYVSYTRVIITYYVDITKCSTFTLYKLLFWPSLILKQVESTVKRYCIIGILVYERTSSKLTTQQQQHCINRLYLRRRKEQWSYRDTFTSYSTTRQKAANDNSTRVLRGTQYWCSLFSSFIVFWFFSTTTYHWYSMTTPPSWLLSSLYYFTTTEEKEGGWMMNEEPRTRDMLKPLSPAMTWAQTEYKFS